MYIVQQIITPESLCTYPRIFVYIDPRIFVYINAHFYDFFKIQKVPKTRINTSFFDVLPIRGKPRFYSIAKNPIYLYISLYQQARRRLMLPGVADKMKSARQQQPFLYWRLYPAEYPQFSQAIKRQNLVS